MRSGLKRLLAGFLFILSSGPLLPGPAVATAAANETVPALDAELSSYPYPFPVQYFDLAVQGQTLRMAYMDVQAERPDAPTAVLLHGKNFNGAYWQTTAQALNNQGWRVLMPDQIGFGKSTKPAHLQYSFQQLAHNTKALLDKLEIDKATVVGHSMGGMLATRFAVMYPDVTERLVLVNPIGLEDYKTFAPYQTVEQWYQGELAKDREKIRQYQQKNYYDGQWRDAYQPWVDILAGWSKHPDYPRVAWNAALTYDMIYTQPVVYDFPRVQSPALLIIGTRDRTALGKNLVDAKTRAQMGRFDQLGKTTRDAIPRAKLVELEGVGHLPHIEAFERFLPPLLEFLAPPRPVLPIGQEADSNNTEPAS